MSDTALPPAAPDRPVKLRLQGVTRSFAAGVSRFTAVRDVSLDVHDGEFLSIVGPSGCGKTTLLNIMAGLDRPDSGSVTCDGNPVQRPGPERLVIFQEPSLLPWLSVAGNVEFGLRVRGVPARERRERAQRFLKMVHLGRFAGRYPFQLSGGMKQRAAIARALAVEPGMLLMDEPFSALDHRSRDLLHLELQELWLATRTTIVFVTHSVEEALRLSDRIVIMSTQPGSVRRIIEVGLPHPRDFFDPTIVRMRASILVDLEDELNRLAAKEGDDDWNIKEGSLRHPARTRVDGAVGSSS
jgi:NitT/TauT family transport system ATP-binding protein